MKAGTPCHIEFPDRAPGAAGITAMQTQILVDLGVSRNELAPLGVDQASELIRACVIAHAWARTMEASDNKQRGALDPAEPIKGFAKHYELPDRSPGERNSTPVQARILRELEVHEDVCPGLGVDQASVLIRDVTIDTMEKRAIATIRRAYDATKHG